MRRPLWTLTMCLAGLIALWQWLAPPPKPGSLTTREGRVPEEGETLLVWGYVDRIERNTSYQGEEILLYLNQSIQGKFTSYYYRKEVLPACRDESDCVEDGGIVCHISPDKIPRMGSLVLVRGRLSYYEEASNPGQWDARAYYRHKGIEAGLEEATLVEESKSYSYLRHGLFRLREHWRARLYEAYPAREAGILSAMLLGEKKGVERETLDLYRKGGIIHILSISGLHISILGMGLYRLVKKTGLALVPSALISGSFLYLYGMMVDFPLSAIRAIGMFLVFLLGECLHRTYDTMTALGCMALVMLAARPDNIHNSGFLFSFGSLCGIVLFVPFFQTLWKAGKKKILQGHKGVGQAMAEAVTEALGAGVGISVFTLPIHLWFYYEAPVYSVGLNFLVLPLMGIVMGSGLVVMMIPGMGWLRFINVGILGACDRLCLIMNRLPHSLWRPGRPEAWQVAGFYALLLLAVWLGEGDRDRAEEKAAEGKIISIAGMSRWRGILCVAVALVLVGIRPRWGLQVTFLHVDQGDGICIETGGEAYLVDCGSTGWKSVGEKILIPYLKYRGIHTLKAVIMTHPDRDHVNGILELLEYKDQEGIRVESIILPDIGEGDEELIELEAAIRQLAPRVPLLHMKEGAGVVDGRLRMECLHPAREEERDEGEYETTNAYSLCFLLRYGKFQALLTGDVEGQGEIQLVETVRRRAIGHVSVLKVAHHGSRSSTGRELLEEISPSMAILSYGAGNSYGHPHRETLDRLEEVGAHILHTPIDGAVGIWTDGRRMKVKGFLTYPPCGIIESGTR